MTTYYIEPNYTNSVLIHPLIAAQLRSHGVIKSKTSHEANIVIGPRTPIKGKIVYGPLFKSNKGITFRILRGKPYLPKTWFDSVRTQIGTTYFVKPENGSKGRGIRIVKGTGTILSQSRTLIQETVSSLILPFAGSPPRKFDIRFYASLTVHIDGSTQIITDDDAYMKFSSSAYIAGKASTEITNVSRQDPNGYKECLCLLSKYHLSEDGLMDLTGLISLMKEYAEDALLTYVKKRIEGVILYRKAAMVNIYGFDFIATEDGLDVKILEINSMPGVEGRLKLGPFNPMPLVPILSKFL